MAFEEPVTVRRNDDGRYWVTFPVEGSSDPTVVIDPPAFVIEVDLQIGQVELVPEM
jgi:hypothetical protein